MGVRGAWNTLIRHPAAGWHALVTLAVLVVAPGAGAVDPPPGERGVGGPVVAVGIPVTFTDLSTELPFAFVWDFDYDGITPTIDSTDEIAVWTFTAEGDFDVYHEACNLLGCSSVVKTVPVRDPNRLFADGFESGDVSAWSLAMGL
jgi:hypothetical protein